MIKWFLVYLLSFAAFFALAFYLQNAILDANNVQLRYNLIDVYLFFGFFSIILCYIFKVLNLFPKASDNLGYIYLFTLIAKIGFFVLIFQQSILKQNLSKIESLNILIPMFLFLILEIYFIAKILMKKS